MNRPNITRQMADQYIFNAPATIIKSIRAFVAAGRLDQNEAEKYISTAAKPINAPVMVIGIRGYYLNSMGEKGENDRGIYDDALILIGPGYYQTFNGNTDPRKHENGIAQLLPGWHLFKQGWHGYGKPTGHKAFRTANADQVLPVLRDGQKGIQKGLTINLHSGGFNNTNSAGCQTIFKGQWLEFQQAAYKMMDAENQKELPYLLIEEKYK